MSKPRTPPSGDKHDHLSQAPCWWPDPATPNGLPYIRHDGPHNPAADQGTTRQIEPDGQQPLELARTKSLGYSLFNLEALFNLARLGGNVNVDWWNFATKDGRSLQAAMRYLAPYADPSKP